MLINDNTPLLDQTVRVCVCVFERASFNIDTRANFRCSFGDTTCVH